MLHKTTTFIAVTILAVSASLALAGHTTDSVAGDWHITFKMGEHTGEGTMTLKLDSDKVTGTVETAHTGKGTLNNGKYRDGKLSFTADFEKHESINFTGELKDGKIQGEFATEGMTGTWAATKS
jgi:hypothetical protein